MEKGIAVRGREEIDIARLNTTGYNLLLLTSHQFLIFNRQYSM